MQKMSQTEELARLLAARARRHTLTPEEIGRAMDEQEYDAAGLDALHAALEARGVTVKEEDPDLPPLDEAQIGRLEHELSAEGVGRIMCVCSKFDLRYCKSVEYKSKEWLIL